MQRGEAVTLDDGRVITPRASSASPAGRKIAVSADTASSPDVIEAARGADVLVHEATFAEESASERARRSTRRRPRRPEVAREAEVGLLALTHLSNRYFGGEIEREAQMIFPNTVVPRDLDIIVVPFPERGSPELVKGGATHRHGRVAARSEAAAATVEEGIR